MEDYKKLLTDLYKAHDPERIKQIDYFLKRYKGKERQFFISQQSKYKSKKLVSDSKKIIEEALERIKSQSEGEKPDKNETKAVGKAKPKQIKKPVVPPVEAESEKKVEIEPEKEAEKTPVPLADQTLPSPKVAEEKNDTPPKTARAAYNEAVSEKEKPKRKKSFLYIWGIVILILLALLIFYFFFYTPGNKQVETNTEKTPATIIQEQPKIATPVIEPKQTQPSPAPTSASTLRIAKGSLQLPAHFVACYAVKNEKFAIQKVNELKEKGFDGSYYWIPDFVSDGAPYFKVVIGPFASRMDAMKKLTPVQERVEFDAYVLALK